MKNSRMIGIRLWKRQDAKMPCAKKRERKKSTDGGEVSRDNSWFELQVFTIAYTNTRDNPCESVNVHPKLKELFDSPVPKLALAGRLRCSKHHWEELTRDQEILNIVSEYEIPLLRTPVLNSSFRPC